MRLYQIPGSKLEIIREEGDSEENPDFEIIEKGHNVFTGYQAEERKQLLIGRTLKTMRKYDEKRRTIAENPIAINLKNLVSQN